MRKNVKCLCGNSSFYRSIHRRCSAEKVFLKVLHYSQENTCVGVSLRTFTSAILSKRDSNADVFLWILRTPHSGKQGSCNHHLSRFARIKLQPVQPRQISPYDYMWKLNFILARRDSFPPAIWLDLHAFSLYFSLWSCHFTKLKIHRFPVI